MKPLHSLVLYRQNGVCEIVDTQERSFGGQAQTYYLLKPLRAPASTVFVPVGNKALEAEMRPLLSRDEIFSLVKSIPPCDALAETDPRLRKDALSAVLSSGDRAKLLGLVKGLRTLRADLVREGKKFRTVDDGILKRAEALLNDEFGAVLGIEPSAVEAYIQTEMET